MGSIKEATEMGQLDKLHMKVDNFDTNFVSNMNILRDSEDFFDVTLVSDDEISIQAHKVVLCASSPFFRNVLKLNKTSSPLLYIRGVTNSVLVKMLSFTKVRLLSERMTLMLFLNSLMI